MGTSERRVNTSGRESIELAPRTGNRNAFGIEARSLVGSPGIRACGDPADGPSRRRLAFSSASCGSTKTDVRAGRTVAFVDTTSHAIPVLRNARLLRCLSPRTGECLVRIAGDPQSRIEIVPEALGIDPQRLLKFLRLTWTRAVMPELRCGSFDRKDQHAVTIACGKGRARTTPSAKRHRGASSIPRLRK